MTKAEAETHKDRIEAALRLSAEIYDLDDARIAAALHQLQIRGTGSEVFVYWTPPDQVGKGNVYEVNHSRGHYVPCADLMFRSISPSNYIGLRDTLHWCAQALREQDIFVIDEWPTFIDSIHTLKATLSIHSQAGEPLESLYVLFVWPHGATVPFDATAWSRGEILEAIA